MEVLTARRVGHRELSAPAVRAVSAVSRIAAAWLLAGAALLAGMGILYLIRGEALLRIGPELRGALPLEQLAGGDTQPLARLVVAWVPAGFAAGLVLATLTRLSAMTRVASLAAAAAVVLIATGALSDAIAVNDPVGPHVASQFSRPGTLAAVALFALGGACAGLLRPKLARPSRT